MNPPTAMGAPMVGRRVVLERLQPRHTAGLYEIASKDTTASVWPMLGQPVPLEEFGSYLWHLSSLQFAILRRDTNDPIGVVQAVDEDLRSGTVGIGLIVDPELWRAGWPLEGVVLFLDFLFTGVGYRKAYCNMPTSVLERIGGALGSYLTTELVQPQQLVLGDVVEDVHILSIHVRDWDSEFARGLTGNAPLTRKVAAGA